MFRYKLEECLKNIFEVDRIIYGDVSEGSEQNAVYVSINQIKTSPKNGECYFRVEGRLAINAEAVNYKYGYLKERCLLANKKYTKYFGFASTDNNIEFTNYNDLYVKPSLDFTFRVSIPWNLPRGKIKAEKINWVLKIVNLIKGN